MKKMVFGVKLNVAAYDSIRKSILCIGKEEISDFVCFANVHMVVEANKKDSFASIVNNSRLTVADGVPLTWALRNLHQVEQERIAGMDLLPDVLLDCESEGIPVYFYGGTQGLLDQTLEYLRIKHPAIKIAGMYSPPFRDLTQEEEKKVVNNINASNAKIIFVVLGCPKQEKWMYHMKGKINGLMLGIGAALPVLVGSQKRAPEWMQKKGLEWLFRLCQEPKRLFKRYFVTNTYFLFLFLKYQLSKTFRMSTSAGTTIRSELKY